MRTLLAIWLPTTFTIVCVALCFLSLWFALPALFGAGDARARYKEFKFLKDFDWSNRLILMKMSSSMCTRFAAISACSSSERARIFYRKLGYRWYHILPDGTFSIKNNPYLSIKFYRKLLGV